MPRMKPKGGAVGAFCPFVVIGWERPDPFKRIERLDLFCLWYGDGDLKCQDPCPRAAAERGMS